MKSRLRKSYRRAGVSVSRWVIYEARNESFITFRLPNRSWLGEPWPSLKDLYDDESRETIRKSNPVARWTDDDYWTRCELCLRNCLSPGPPLRLFLRPRNLRRFYDPLSSLRVILFHALAITLAGHQLEQREEEELFREENSNRFSGKGNSHVLLVFVKKIVEGCFAFMLERIRVLLIREDCKFFEN